MAAAKKIKAPALLIAAFGKGAGKKPAPDSDDEASEAEESEDSEEVPPDFEDEAIAAFPELDGSPERVAALFRAVKCCM